MNALLNVRTGQTVASRIELATTRADRRRGLLGRNAIDRAAALVIAPCCAIHTGFMRFAIDVVFVNGDGRVVRIAVHVPPWRMVIAPRAYAAIELAAGTLESCPIAVGDCLSIPSGDAAASSPVGAPQSFRRMMKHPAAHAAG